MLRLSHDFPSSGHLGIRKTLSKVRQNYYWPGLEQDVKIYVIGCDKKQKSLYQQKGHQCKLPEVGILWKE